MNKSKAEELISEIQATIWKCSDEGDYIKAVREIMFLIAEALTTP